MIRELVPDVFKGRGVVIAFEGIDYCGKTTLIEKLREKIAETGRRPPKVFAEPRKDTEDWKRIREMVISPDVPKRTQAALSLAQRASVYEEQIKPEILKHRAVFTDRSVLTSMVYQRDGIEFGPYDILRMNTGFKTSFRRQAGDNIVPDVIVFMGMSHKTYMERLGKNRSKIEDIENQLTDPEVFQDFSDWYIRGLSAVGDISYVIESKDVDEIYEKLKFLGCNI